MSNKSITSGGGVLSLGNSTGSKTHQHLRSKITIGSCKNPQLNYASTQSVFKAEDARLGVREKKQEILDWLHPNRLENMNVKNWNMATKVEEKPLLCNRRCAENLVHDHKTFENDFRLEVLPPKKEMVQTKKTMLEVTLKNELLRPVPSSTQRTNLPIHPNLNRNFTEDWNNSTEQTFNKKILQQSLDKITAAALDHSRKATTAILTQSQRAYANPLKQTSLLNEEVRRQKRAGTFSTERQIFTAPEEPVDRTMLRNRYAIEPSLKYTTSKHSGVWELNKLEGRYMWSDTASFEYNSKGDLSKTHNPDAYIFAKPTLSK